jgi:hypothetical protein
VQQALRELFDEQRLSPTAFFIPKPDIPVIFPLYRNQKGFILQSGSNQRRIYERVGNRTNSS